MDIEEEDITLIERYANFQLSEEELSTFEKRIGTDPNFAENVYLYQESEDVIRKSLATKQQQQRKQAWEEILGQKNNHTAAKQNNIPWKWIGAIAASLLIMFGIWQTNKKEATLDMPLLLENGWKRNVGLDYKLIRGAEEDSLKIIILDAFESYENTAYNETLDQLKNFKSKKYYEDVLLLRALSLYKEGAVDNALKTLDTLSKYPTQKKSNVALWYQGLIYLEQDDHKKATLFLDIPDTQNKGIRLKKK